MRIETRPAHALYDEIIAIRVCECPPGAAVTVRASADDDLGRRWESHAVFVADPDGVVDLSRHASGSGSYPGRDPMGLFWSMRVGPEVQERGPFLKLRPTPVTFTIRAESGDHAAEAQVMRTFMGPGVRRREIREAGMVATFFDHEDGPRPGVVMLAGSGGGLAEDMPALLASHGYAVLSLGYFAMEGLPQDLANIPLEYFGRALEWMGANASVRGDRVAVIGASRGGELALLLGATFPHVKAVIAYVPSGIVWGGIERQMSGKFPPAWTLEGRPVPFMSPSIDPEPWTRSPVALAPSFLKQIKNGPDAAAQAEIAVEKINGPVLMFSGTDDQMWPSLVLADIAVQRLSRSAFSHKFEHVSYAGAGHFIRFPFSPVITEIFHPIVRTMMALGGEQVANAAADLDSWRRLLSFLSEHL